EMYIKAAKQKYSNNNGKEYPGINKSNVIEGNALKKLLPNHKSPVQHDIPKNHSIQEITNEKLSLKSTQTTKNGIVIELFTDIQPTEIELFEELPEEADQFTQITRDSGFEDPTDISSIDKNLQYQDKEQSYRHSNNQTTSEDDEDYIDDEDDSEGSQWSGDRSSVDSDVESEEDDEIFQDDIEVVRDFEETLPLPELSGNLSFHHSNVQFNSTFKDPTSHSCSNIHEAQSNATVSH
ncbi:uncharacterized transmembrane protein DDB_G0283675-like, partial [Copidosoma floridanum]|uniref:uncharacterized transmembrane protein DDB_G0283675-like n=1 Tax=Copidosoma floridanum TaxID=29053 RepID=UPI000C6FB4C7